MMSPPPPPPPPPAAAPLAVRARERDMALPPNTLPKALAAAALALAAAVLAADPLDGPPIREASSTCWAGRWVRRPCVMRRVPRSSQNVSHLAVARTCTSSVRTAFGSGWKPNWLARSPGCSSRHGRHTSSLIERASPPGPSPPSAPIPSCSDSASAAARLASSSSVLDCHSSAPCFGDMSMSAMFNDSSSRDAASSRVPPGVVGVPPGVPGMPFALA
mmetsp:Transcript_25936/g.60705  ORF Transcript_25936/g.60705 Transcript_25936/m.60705 type:complete len:218 (-) Transcript_25936:582-1235(-)